MNTVQLNIGREGILALLAVLILASGCDMVRFGNPLGPSNTGLEIVTGDPIAPEGPGYWVDTDNGRIIIRWYASVTAHHYALYYSAFELNESDSAYIPPLDSPLWTFQPVTEYGGGFYTTTISDPPLGIITRLDPVFGNYYELPAAEARSLWIQSVKDDSYSELVWAGQNMPPMGLYDLDVDEHSQVFDPARPVEEFEIGSQTGTEALYFLNAGDLYLQPLSPENAPSSTIFTSPITTVQTDTVRVNGGGLFCFLRNNDPVEFSAYSITGTNFQTQYMVSGQDTLPADVFDNGAQMVDNNIFMYVTGGLLYTSSYFWNGSSHTATVSSVSGLPTLQSIYRCDGDSSSDMVALVVYDTNSNPYLVSGNYYGGEFTSRDLQGATVESLVMIGSSVFYGLVEDTSIVIYRLFQSGLNTGTPVPVMTVNRDTFQEMASFGDYLVVRNSDGVRIINVTDFVEVPLNNLPAQETLTGMAITSYRVIFWNASGLLYMFEPVPMDPQIYVLDLGPYPGSDGIVEVKDSPTQPQTLYVRNSMGMVTRVSYLYQ